MIRFESTKTLKTAIVLLLVLIILVPPLYRSVFESTPFRSADEGGVAYVDKAFNRALIAFALARASNAIISVIQDSEIDIAPAGVGVTIAIGEALDPLNDMIERFSWVMLVSLVSLGIQKLLIEISPWVSVKFILLPGLVMILVGYWVNRRWADTIRHYGLRLLFLAVLIRFCIPAVALINEQVYGLFLDKHYATAVAGIEQGNAALRGMDPTAEDSMQLEDEGFWANLRNKAGKVVDIVDLKDRVNRMKDRLTGMIENLLKMIAVFLLNTVLLPIGFLWMLIRLFRLVTGDDSLRRMERVLVQNIAGRGESTAMSPSKSETLHPGGDRHDTEVDEKNKNIETE